MNSLSELSIGSHTSSLAAVGSLPSESQQAARICVAGMKFARALVNRVYELKLSRIKGLTRGAWSTPLLLDGSLDEVYQYQSSIKVDQNGTAHLAYYKTTGADLYYANDSSGSMVTGAAFTTGSVGAYPSLTLRPDGFPYITAFNGSARDLYLFFPLQNNWASLEIYAHPSNNYVGYWASAAMDQNGFFHVSHQNQTARDLIYTTNVSGVFKTYEIDTINNVGSYTSLGIDSQGFIHISYYDETNTNLKYTTNKSGSFVTETIDNAGSVGTYSSLQIASDDTVRIAYYSATGSALKFANNVGGAWNIVQIDGFSSNTGGSGVALSLDRLDRPHISYADVNGTRLMHAYYDTNDSQWVLEEVDGGGANTVGYLSSIFAR